MLMLAAVLGTRPLDFADVHLAQRPVSSFSIRPDAQVVMAVADSPVCITLNDQSWAIGRDDLLILNGCGLRIGWEAGPEVRLMFVAAGWRMLPAFDGKEVEAFVAAAANDADGNQALLREALLSTAAWSGRTGEHSRAKLATALLIAAIGGSNVASMSGIRDLRVIQLLSAIHKQPQLPWTLPTMAQKIGLKRSTLAKLFKAETGVTPGAYLREIRLQVAARLLWQENASAKAAALAAGFSSVPSFTLAFRERFGVTPGRSRSA